MTLLLVGDYIGKEEDDDDEHEESPFATTLIFVREEEVEEIEEEAHVTRIMSCIGNFVLEEEWVWFVCEKKKVSCNMDREEDWSKKGKKQMSVVFQGFLEDGGD